jgi:hypothetical protein
MLVDSQERHYSKRDHAFWRVQFRRSLLISHQATASNSPDWLKKEVEFESWLQEAMDALNEVDPDDQLLSSRAFA